MLLKPKSQFCERDAFTLLELLVVVCVVTLLSALLLPVYSMGKKQAQTTLCINNLRQIGVAFHLYVDENNCYPVATSDGLTGAWERAIEPLPDSVYYCPVLQVPSAKFMQIFNLTSGMIAPHYGYNVFGAAYEGSPPYNPGLGGDTSLTDNVSTPTPASRIIVPSQMIVAGDSRTFIDVIFGTQSETNIPNQIYLTFPYPVEGFGFAGVGSWHNTNANMVFADAHVQLAPQQYWVAATDESRRLWNSDNQPHPEWW
jgi:prepilin-type processing-associated H-X9-DG protein